MFGGHSEFAKLLEQYIVYRKDIEKFNWNCIIGHI